jgi:GNAT superfamily N-acetyltransferase
MSGDLTLRPATSDDVPALNALIERSARALSVGFYDERETESAIRFVFGVDTSLIADGTYFAVERGGQLVGCGGWSRRRTLYGGDQRPVGERALLDPAVESAKIRAFFVAPEAARQGIGRRLLEACVGAAGGAGFQTLELMATLPGVPLYAACGFQEVARITEQLPDGVAIEFVRMTRPIRDPRPTIPEDPPMRDIVASIEAEYQRYKALAEGAIAQLDDAQLSATDSSVGNSITVLVWHIAGNLRSRFTDFLTSDGEKPWRQRDEEFVARAVPRAEVMEKWESGWKVLLDTLGTLADDDLSRIVTIRGTAVRVAEALHRSLAHVASHVGQIVYISKSLRDGEWKYLSIPPGQSAAYNQAPAYEKPLTHAERLSQQPKS